MINNNYLQEIFFFGTKNIHNYLIIRPYSWRCISGIYNDSSNGRHFCSSFQIRFRTDQLKMSNQSDLKNFSAIKWHFLLILSLLVSESSSEQEGRSKLNLINGVVTQTTLWKTSFILFFQLVKQVHNNYCFYIELEGRIEKQGNKRQKKKIWIFHSKHQIFKFII